MDDHPAPAVARSVDLDAPPAEVWAALTEDALLSEWFGADVTLDPVPGGNGTFAGDDGVRRQARVDEADPGRRLSWRWWIDGDDDGPISAVTFELVPVPSGTRLVVTERPLLLGTAWATASLGPALARLRARVALVARA